MGVGLDLGLELDLEQEVEQGEGEGVGDLLELGIWDIPGRGRRRGQGHW